VIKLNQKMLILKRFVTKKKIFLCQDQVKWFWTSSKMEKIKYQKHRLEFCFNCVIELKICCKNWFVYVMMTTELLIKYFCSIKLCCLWTFDEQLFLLKYCFIFTVLGPDTSTLVSKVGLHRCHKDPPGGRGLTFCCGQWCN
jgi:hypothetical protein